jgi:uncharacterized membrane protein YkgB
VLAVLHLLGTFTILFFSPAVLFEPAFPVLSMTGEFVAKNVVLIAAAVALLLQPETLQVRKPLKTFVAKGEQR